MLMPNVILFDVEVAFKDSMKHAGRASEGTIGRLRR